MKYSYVFSVRLYTWLPPLIDLLAHPKMKLLMTHGGLYSNQETVWNGVPLIGLPIFGDQVTIKNKILLVAHSYLVIAPTNR